jgi:hypothetical protein
MWHEGGQLARIIPSLQQFEYEEPYGMTQEVVVPASGSERLGELHVENVARALTLLQPRIRSS